MKKVFDISGMTCAACAAHIEKAVKKIGADSVEVNLLMNKMTVDTDIPESDIISAVEGAGYGARIAGNSGAVKSDAARPASVDYSRALLIRFLLSIAFLLPLMYFSMGHMASFPMGGLDPHKNPSSFALIQLVLTTPVLIINGKFFINGVKALFHRAPNMDTLVSLGSGASYIYGLVLAFVINARMAGGDVHGGAELAMGLFFESAAMILALVTLGKFLEAKSKGKTRSEVDKLMRMRPQTATVVRDGAELVVSVDDIAVGDTVIVLSGEYVPCDGVISRGSTTLDKSAITGESLPEEATVGSKVTSATLNLTGRIELEATAVGSDSTLGKIIELIENAGGSKAPIQKIADRVSAVFVPTVCAISLVTLVVWLIIGSVPQALTMAISVLVISCPCALGLATPVAVMAGTGRAAAYGVLVKNAEVLQGLQDVDVFALDKTATITEGKPRVIDIRAFGALAEDKILAISAALEKTSTHPLAQAIVEEACKRGYCALSATGGEYRIGYGVTGTVDGENYAIGSARLMREWGAECDDEQSQTVYLCKRGELLGAVTVADEIKPSSARAIKLLKDCGARVVMLTGDNRAQAERVAEKVGITEVYCNVLPGDKLDIVKSLKSGGRVAMVGDGINDAPALKEADIGIAIGSGTDVAIEAADVVLVKSDLVDVPRAMAVSHASLKNIKENLFWAFIYNVLGIPLAAGVLYGVGITLDPMIAAAAMAFSSLFVVCNALRLTVMKFDDARIERKLASVGKHKRKKRSENKSELSITEIGGKGMDTVLNIKGMMCMHCVGRVKSALEKVEGVTGVDVDLEKGTAVVHGASANIDAAIQAVVDAGYEASR